jgi:hypothetical protein
MKVLYKDLWDIHAALNQYEFICITTNGSIRRDGCAVMGRGCAYEATQKFPDIQKKLGGLLAKSGNHVYCFSEYNLFTFPVKTTWDQQASLNLIQQSCHELADYIGLSNMAIKVVYLPKPGCNNGRLHWDNVEPVIDAILKNKPVTIVDRPPQKP